MIYLPKYFTIKELVSPIVYNGTSENEKEKLWWLFDERVLKTADMLRDKYGPIVCNDWNNALRYCGFREEDTSVGRTFSQHKYGRALDLHPKKTTAEKIRQDILADPWAEEFKYITCLEVKVSWLHFDVRNWNKEKNGIFLVER